MKVTRLIKHEAVAQEVALIGMLGYLSYLAGELAGLSGIVTLFCCAVAISHYALHNVSAPARVTLVTQPSFFIYVMFCVNFALDHLLHHRRRMCLRAGNWRPGSPCQTPGKSCSPWNLSGNAALFCCAPTLQGPQCHFWEWSARVRVNNRTAMCGRCARRRR